VYVAKRERNHAGESKAKSGHINFGVQAKRIFLKKFSKRLFFLLFTNNHAKKKSRKRLHDQS
jgi:hypothetical protein